MYLGGHGQNDGQLYLPAQVMLSYDIPEVFRKDIALDFKAEFLFL